MSKIYEHYTIDKKAHTIENFNTFIELDSKAYEAQYVTSLEKMVERNSCADMCLIAAKVLGKIVGYINYFPISDELFEEIKTGKMITDINIGAEDVATYITGCKVYIMSVVVKPEYRGGKATKLLGEAFQNHMNQLKDSGITPSAIIAMTVSAKGKSFVEKFGLTEYLKIDACKSIMIKSN